MKPNEGQITFYVGIKVDVATLEKLLSPNQIKAFFEGIGEVLAAQGTAPSEPKGAEHG